MAHQTAVARQYTNTAPTHDHTQYVDYKASLQPRTVGDDLISLSGRPAFWPNDTAADSSAAPGGPAPVGTSRSAGGPPAMGSSHPPIAGWPSLGASPALLLPAADTLAPAGGPLPCAPVQLAANASCQAAVLVADRFWYAKVS